MKALEGLKVLDLSMGVAGPHAGMLCAQYGADVIKIEPPDRGDWSRLMGRRYGDMTATSVQYNRGKRSLAVNLKDSQARAIVTKMVEQADVVLENFRPGVMQRFGLDYASLRERNPRLIYLSVTGFGQKGPMSGLPATDIVLQAFSGFMSLNKDSHGVPQRLDLVAMDIVTGLYAFQAITTSLIERQHTGLGKHIDCSLMQSAIALQTLRMMEYVLQGSLQNMYVPIGTMRTLDGFLAIGVMHDHDYSALCQVIEREDLATNPLYDTMAKRVKHEKELMAILREVFQRFSTDELVRRLEQAKVLHSRVLDYTQLLAHPQVQAMSVVTWLDQDGFDGSIPVGNVPGAPPSSVERNAQAPHKGEHSRVVLAEWGISDEEIAALLQRSAISCYPEPNS